MSRWLVLACACVLALAASSASPALAQRNPLIARGQQEYDELRFEEALQTLSAALVRSGNSRQQQALVYRLLAFTYLALGREEEASGAYRSMLPSIRSSCPARSSPAHPRVLRGRARAVGGGGASGAKVRPRRWRSGTARRRGPSAARR
ncbi:MAG: hypothetical protein M5U28_29525 [Sandaracinaceae bacterium]|nr:hypothetical protein [Sandaracinaceae bacterium]